MVRPRGLRGRVRARGRGRGRGRVWAPIDHIHVVRNVAPWLAASLRSAHCHGVDVFELPKLLLFEFKLAGSNVSKLKSASPFSSE